MMNYTEFKEAVRAGILSYMPKEFNDWTVKLTTVHKVNGDKDAIVISKGNGTFPTLYLDESYKMYGECGDFKEIMENMARCLLEAINSAPPVNSVDITSWEWVKEKVVPALINREKNTELLKTVPHRDFLDLSIIYRIMIDVEEEQSYSASAAISNEHLKMWGIKETDLFNASIKNSSPEVNSLTDATIKALPESMPEDVRAEIIASMEEDTMPFPTFVASNKQNSYGAGVIVHGLSEIAESTGYDRFFILPSSIHEVIIVPECFGETDGETDGLKAMVREANETLLGDEVLSDNVYIYDNESKMLTIA